MRPLNISYLRNITKEDLFSDCENALSGRPERERIRRADQVALRSLIKTLFRAGLDETACYDGFFFSFWLKAANKSGWEEPTNPSRKTSFSDLFSSTWRNAPTCGSIA